MTLVSRITGYLRGQSRPLLESGFAIIVGLAASASIMAAAGYDPLSAYFHLFKGGFGSAHDLKVTLGHMIPIMLTATTFLIGIRSGVLNIGAEGQLYLGAVGAVAVGALLSLPAGLHLVLAVGAAMLCGFLWALIPAVLKVRRGINEILSTLMFNYIAYFLAYFLILSYMMHPVKGYVTKEVLETARFTVLDRAASLSTAIFLSFAVCILVYVLLWHTRLGYELRLTGDNPEASRYAGINYARVGLLSFILGGLIAGLAGGAQILGRPGLYCIRTDFANIFGYGWTGIAVALIGRNHPIGVIPAALFMAGMRGGAKYMQARVGVPIEMIAVVHGIIMIALAVPELLKIVRERLK